MKQTTLPPSLMEKYYNSIFHLRVAKKYVRDILALEDCLQNFSVEKSINTLFVLVKKYQRYINKIGDYATDITTINGAEAYAHKNNDDLIFDITYLIRVIVVVAAAELGFEQNIFVILNKLKAEGYNICGRDPYN